MIGGDLLRRGAHRTALRVLLGGLALWVATVVVTWTTQNPTLIPTVILLGSFLVPVAFVLWAVDSGTEHVAARDVVLAFVVGGVLGILGASLLETRLLQGGGPVLGMLGVGLIEELMKLGAVWLLARRLSGYTVRDGAVFGAAVGLGFAAFESAGYAFNAALGLGGLDLRALVETEILRGLLAPVGHGLWTAVLGATLFAAARAAGRLRVTGPVVGWYLVVSLLHAVWNLSGGIAAVVVWFRTAQVWQYQLLAAGRLPSPTPEQAHLFTLCSWAIMVIVAGLGLACLRRVLPRSRPGTGHPMQDERTDA
ncbi:MULTISPECIES: PrsW family glutamic-type intramembrane protease [unclassified Pseudonocardia]|uniref:PrsW family intramembrane metalloprotease n=1 Tax=unclassified Pseudonocardia TaxID=2619320 RepID=UPI0001FFEF46|nr:PrsW family glutamic-type intramembrane protease [Pseudonocardia sp. Ae707_Ps1]OLM17370.1 putative integral membrane protein [Pseudonocardia sp. Ae707_Ps1]